MCAQKRNGAPGSVWFGDIVLHEGVGSFVYEV